MRGCDPQFLPRRLAALRGEKYDPEKFNDLYKKLYLTGLYDTIDIQEVPQADNTIELVANPQEAKQPGYMSATGEGG